MKSALLSIVVALTLVLGLTACKSSHQEGVKSSYHAQWTMVNANTMKTTDAAKAVLESEGLRDVQANSTNMDGKATAKMADGTKVNVAIQKKGDTQSEVSVTVGTMGSPSTGAELAKKIKDRAEGR
jgi:Zn-dependent membrane protease YugP